MRLIRQMAAGRLAWSRQSSFLELQDLRRLLCPLLACGLAAPVDCQQLRSSSGSELPEAPQAQLSPATTLAAGRLVAEPTADSGQEPAPSTAPAQAASSSTLPLGSISGTVTDRDGAVLQGAHISLSQTVAGYTSIRELVSAADGSFVVAEVSAGSFELTISSAGFVSKTTAGILQAGETQRLPSISLRPGLASEVDVSLSRTDIAEDQIKQQEQQRVFGVLPNYYVSYLGNALPLTPRQKFELAWKSSVDPVSFGVTGLIAGIQQADNAFPGYGQGATGYGRRYGANYADLVSGTVIGGAILPTLFKQDPRYFYKGSGGVRARVLYALATSVICKGDNGRWQTNYSGVLGSLAAGGLSNLYYPDSDRNGAGLTFRNTLIGTGSTAISNLFQEFLVRKLTPRSRQPPPAAAEIRPTSSKP